MAMDITEIKKLTTEYAKKLAKKHGLSFGKKSITGHPEFFRITEYGYNVFCIEFSFQFNTFYIYRPSLCFNMVEEILSNIAKDSSNLDSYYPTTLHANEKKQDGTYVTDAHRGYNIQTVEDLQSKLLALNEYMEEVALPFFSKYGDLREVLKLIDELESNVEREEESSLYFPGSDALKRKIIIRKLCNSDIYEKKIEEYRHTEELISQYAGYEKSLENFDKIVAYLKTVEALY